MRKASVRELHIHTSELVREAADGGVIVIERRGEPVAELRSLSAAQPLSDQKKIRILASLKKLRNSMPEFDDCTKIIEEDRNR